MAETEIDGFEELVRLIDRALAGKGEDQAASQVKKILEDVICSQSVSLPPAMKVAQSDRYARRLLYRSSRYGYEVIALIWGPGSGNSTPRSRWNLVCRRRSCGLCGGDSIRSAPGQWRFVPIPTSGNGARLESAWQVA